jgi:hypothetical protein
VPSANGSQKTDRHPEKVAGDGDAHPDGGTGTISMKRPERSVVYDLDA